MTTNFQQYNLDGPLLKALEKMGIHTPTEIQQESISKILDSDSHVMAQAKTGSGKTLAFSIPVAQKLDPHMNQVQAIILVPTRELCAQVHSVFENLTQFHPLSTVEVYGGKSIEPQIQKVQDGAQIVVATPGRLIDLYNRNAISFKHVQFVILDEADRMLDMGFLPDIEFLLLDAMKNVHPRLLLYSATLLEQIQDLGRRFTGNAKPIMINVSEDELTVANCHQYYYLIDEYRDKFYHFVRIMAKERPKHSIIFVNTKKTGEWLYDRLRNERSLDRFRFEMIMGSLSQKRREIVLDKFRKQKINCLIATDVAARGLDIDDVSHVFNYDIPEFEEVYVHRIGRTARITGKSGKAAHGTALSLVVKDQYAFLARIEAYQGKDIEKRALPPRHSRRNNPRQSSPQSGPPPHSGPKKKSYPKKQGNSQKPDHTSRRNFLY